jgi:hypothetical protein
MCASRKYGGGWPNVRSTSWPALRGREIESHWSSIRARVRADAIEVAGADRVATMARTVLQDARRMTSTRRPLACGALRAEGQGEHATVIDGIGERPDRNIVLIDDFTINQRRPSVRLGSSGRL